MVSITFDNETNSIYVKLNKKKIAKTIHLDDETFMDIDKNGKILLETENDKIKFNFFEIEKANIDPNWAINNN